MTAKWDGSLIMPADAVSHGESHHESYGAIYLTKNPRYELTVVAPQGSPTRLNWEQAVVHARVKATVEGHDIILPLAHLKVFYEDLSRLREYLGSSSGLVPHRDST